MTIRIPDETALWARRKAAEENTSLSRLVGEMLERQMRLTDDYWRAFEHWKSNRPLAASGATRRMTREQVHRRR
ncbi:MAG: CopG family transcriptional regulator [Acidobacteria bacterium]|nr:CopG family transcriptional regulator [Acidobacteriota bacterium]